MGDFNVISDWSEKKGGRRRDDGSMRDFNEFVSNMGLVDIGSLGRSFTWCNNQQGWSRIYKRLDRVLLNGPAVSALPSLSVRQVDRFQSDHCPLIIECQRRLDRLAFFSFHAMWIEHEDFLRVVNETWKAGRHVNPMKSFMANLKELRSVLRVWNWQTFGDLERQVGVCQKEVEDADLELLSQWSLQGEERLKRAQGELEVKLRAKFQLLEEKSRLAWLKEGDRNSALFHTAMKVRRARSRVHIELPDGSWTEDRDKIGPAAVSVFQNLLGPHVSPDTPEVLDVIPSVISSEENSSLVRMPTMEELKEVVWSIDVSSAPGPDGFTSLFYRHCWSLICEDLLAAVCWFFRPGSYLPPSVTATHLTLIPKSMQPRSLGDLRPISLCNVIHKIISKLLNMRLRPLLPRLVGSEQAAFVEGRSIHENIVLAQEVCRDIHKKVWGGILC